MDPVFNMTRLTMMLVAVVGIGVATLLCAGRRTRTVTLVLLALLVVPVLFYVRLRASVAPQTATVSLPLASFEPSAEQLRHGKVFPSIGQATTVLSARVADSLGNLPEGRRETGHVVLIAPPEVRANAIAGLRTALPRAQQFYESGATTRPTAPDDVQLRIEVISTPPITGRMASVPRRGVVKATASGASGTLEDSVQFIEKPWAGDADAGGRSGAHGTIVGRSQSPCTSEAEALAQARDMAAAQVGPLLKQRLAENGGSDVESDEPWFWNRINAEVHSPRFIQDEFVQELAMPYGSVFRASVLVSASGEKISQLCNQLTAERRQRTVHTLSTAGAIGALSVLILLVYLFLNAVTRGYFTLRLRLLAFGLLAAAVLLVMMVA